MGDMNTTGLGMGMSAAAGYARYQQANAQHEQAKTVQSLDAQSAQSALMSTMRNLEQEQEVAAQQAISTSIDTQKASAVAQGTALAEAGASNMAGSSVDKSMNDSSLEASRTMSKTALNLENKQKELNTSATLAVTQANQRIQPMQSQQPNPYAFAAEAGVKGFRNVLSLRGVNRKGGMF